MCIRFFLSLSLPLLLIGSGQAGVAYYSGFDSSAAGNSVIFDYSTNSNTWSPIDGFTSVGVNGEKSGEKQDGTIFELDGTADEGGSATPYNVYLSVGGSTQLQGFAYSQAPAETPGLPDIGRSASPEEFTIQGDATNTDASTTASVYDLLNVQSLVRGYSSSDNNYFAWMALNATTLHAIGWARYEVSSSNFKIIDWAYTLASPADSNIAFGETGADPNSGGNNNGTVPEPTGLAIFGLVLAGAAVSRRKRN